MHQIIDFAQTSGISALRERDRLNPGHPLADHTLGSPDVSRLTLLPRNATPANGQAVIPSKNTQMITFRAQKDQNPVKTRLNRPLPCSPGALQPCPNRAFFGNSTFTLISFSRRRLARLRFVTKGPKRPTFSPCSYFVQDRCPFFPLPIHLPSASIRLPVQARSVVPRPSGASTSPPFVTRRGQGVHLRFLLPHPQSAIENPKLPPPVHPVCPADFPLVLFASFMVPPFPSSVLTAPSGREVASISLSHSRNSRKARLSRRLCGTTCGACEC